jgi:TonB family protein
MSQPLIQTGRFCLWAMTAVIASGQPAFAAQPSDEPEVQGSGAEGAYLRAVHDRVHARWNDNFLRMVAAKLPKEHALNAPELEVVMQVTVTPTGAVIVAAVERSSGQPEFDRAAREVLEDSSPLPPPPEQVLSDDQRAHFNWTLARGKQGCAGVALVQKEGPLEQAVPWLVTHNREQDAARRLRAAPAIVRERAFALWARTWLEAALKDRQLARTAAIGLMNLGHPRAEALVRKAVLERELDEIEAAVLDRTRFPLPAPALLAGPSLPDIEREPVTALRAAAIVAWATPERARLALIRLSPMLRDPSVEIRIAAIAGLLQAAGDSSLDQLYLLFKEKDPRPYQAAAAGLARLRSEASAQLLVRMLQRSDPNVRLAAAAALAARADQHARKALAIVRRHQDAQVRVFAAALMDPPERLAAVNEAAATATGPGLYRALLTGSAKALAIDWLLAQLPGAPAATKVQLLALWSASAAGERNLAEAATR